MMNKTEEEMIHAQTFVTKQLPLLTVIVILFMCFLQFFLPFKLEKCKQVYKLDKTCLKQLNSKDLSGAAEFKGGEHTVICFTDQRQDIHILTRCQIRTKTQSKHSPKVTEFN